MHNYCTLFDRNYLHRGLALHQSLIDNDPNFTLWILCMDEITHQTLERLSLPKVKLIKLSDFENEKLLKVKAERNVAEYSWTCTSNLCRYMLEVEKLDDVSYLDADLYFFDNPEPIFKEIGQNSIGIVEHRFPLGREKFEKTVGKYNVGFVYFKNSPAGIEAVRWWSDKVIEWCFDRVEPENNRYGDQMYLNDWPNRFREVTVIKNEGVGLAPWNIQTNLTEKIIFYHFHAFKMIDRNQVIEAKGYFIPRSRRETIYQIYTEAIREAINKVAHIDPTFNYGFSQIATKDKILYYLYNRIIPESIFPIFSIIRIFLQELSFEKVKVLKKKFIEKNFFRPVWYSVFFNPYFISRFSLYRETKKFATIAIETKSILDVGCGNKPYQTLFRTQNYIGIDIEGGGHHNREKTLDLTFDGRIIPFANNQFEAVICTQVLEHAEEPEILLTEMTRVLKTKGKMFLTVPFVWNEHETPYDFRRFTRYELVRLCQKNNLKIKQLSATTGIFGVLGQLLSAFLYENLRFPSTTLKLLLSFFILSPIQIVTIGLDRLTGKKWLTLDYVIIAEKI